jgi:uncharacterized protein (UPF0212 family)
MTLMTTKEAQERFRCEGCRTGERDCDAKDFGSDCVESETGSTRCPKCNGRCWVAGELSNMEASETCPYCGAEIDGKKWR